MMTFEDPMIAIGPATDAGALRRPGDIRT